MALSEAARLYLLWQIFDAVNRAPMSFAQLADAIPGLQEAWPSFRQEVLRDWRFLEVGGVIDVSTAGIHGSAFVEEIAEATLERARRPMTEQDLRRVIRRLRPEFPAGRDPISDVLRSALFFRPRPVHLALRRWLKGAVPLDLSGIPGASALEVAVNLLQPVGRRVPSASLAAGLASRFGMRPEDAYGIVASPELLLLPDGTVCLYDLVEDEIAQAAQAGAGSSEQAGERQDVVGPGDDGLGESVPVPDGLARDVARLSRTERRALSTEEIVVGRLGITPDDRSLYLAAFWAVQRALGLSAEVLLVGEYVWYAADAVPPEAFRAPRRSRPSVAGPGGPTWVAGLGAVESPHSGEKRDSGIWIPLTADDIEAKVVRNDRLSVILPDHPQIRLLQLGAERLWFNADTCTLTGLGPWMVRQHPRPGDLVHIRCNGNTVTLQLKRQSSGESPKASARPERYGALRRYSKSLLLAVVDLLTRAGGSLARSLCW